MKPMKQVLLSSSLLIALSGPLYAQESADEDGFSLMERGVELFFEGIMREMEPALDDLRGMAEGMEPAMREFVLEMGPAFVELLGKIDDLSAYHPPEMLSNGDIIIRRKFPLTPETEESGEVEL